jgi:hypothetical protein
MNTTMIVLLCCLALVGFAGAAEAHVIVPNPTNPTDPDDCIVIDLPVHATVPPCNHGD